VRGTIVPGPVLPHPPALVPLLPVRPKPTQAQLASPLVELTTRKGGLGDALGLSTVHVNRVLQELRGSDLITLRGGTLTVLDWDGLREAGEFDPAYLHLDPKYLGRQQAA